MRQRNKILIAGSIIILLGMSWVFSNWNHIEKFPRIISAYYSKQFCSCIYVMEQTEDYCHNWTRQWIPISEFSWDKEEKMITAKGLGFETSSIWQDQEVGCSILN